jgi:hypothetical protein
MFFEFAGARIFPKELVSSICGGFIHEVIRLLSVAYYINVIRWLLITRNKTDPRR